MFSQSKAVTSSKVTYIFDILLNQLNISIFALGNPSQGVMGRPMSIEQSMILKGAYTTMKVKLLKYELQVKRMLIFLITTMLDPSYRLEYFSNDEQEYITKTLKHLLQLKLALPISSTCSQSEPLLNTSTTFSKKMVELMKQKWKNQYLMKYLIFRMTLKSNILILMLYSGGVRLGLKNIHDMQC